MIKKKFKKSVFLNTPLRDFAREGGTAILAVLSP